MHPLKTLVLATATAGMFGVLPLAAHAAEGDVSNALSEARQEGSIWTAFALNRHLNPFDIKIDVENGVAVLGGEVETDVEKDLAEQVALGIEGVKKVDNQIRVNPGIELKEPSSSGLAQRFDDATLAATVKSKLLWNSNTEGLDIKVSAENGVITLSGHAQTPAAKELAGRLAENTDGVRTVNNLLDVGTVDNSTTGEVRRVADNAGAIISDAWITSKVKSSYFSSRNLDGLNISVKTRDGVVNLSGTVLSKDEKELAIETARSIRGVRGVEADALRVAS
ncbi:MAG: BON domain-containing protein [Pseudomonas sp.]|uniref:BON domain-containing protein n=1 Tax=Pseudomonas sp. TaxID=306 RepID=UPI003D12455B